MKALFLNDSNLLAYGLAAGFVSDDLRYVPVHIPGWEQPLTHMLRNWQPDFALAEGVAISTVARELFRLLRAYNVPLVYWAIDDPPDWRRMSLRLARGAALVLTPAEECLPLYRKHGIKAQFFHFACNPAFHRPATPRTEFTCDLMFVGNYYTSYPQRRVGFDTLLTPLLAGAYSLKVYGNEHWLDNTDNYTLPANVYQGYLDYRNLPSAYASAKIVLGINSVLDSPTMMSMRIFEVLGCGAFCLTHWTPALENYFQNHVHLVWSRHPDETPELVRYYLARDDLRRQIAQQGQQEVYSKHTYRQRVDNIRPALLKLKKF